MGDNFITAGIIGAGKIASSLVPALIQAGYKIEFILSRHAGSAAGLAEKYDVPVYGSLSVFPQNPVEIIFLTVPDGQIKKTAEHICSTGYDVSGMLFLHLSGSLGLNELLCLKEKGALTGSLHILQSFPDKHPVKINGATGVIEADSGKSMEILKNLAEKLGLESFAVPEGGKVLYHAAGVFAANFLNGNYYNADKFLEAAGINSRAHEIMSKITAGALANIGAKGSAKALSGPLERGDAEVIKNHIEAIKKNSVYALLSYCAQSLSLLEAVNDKYGSLNEGHISIRNILIEELKDAAEKL